jgi:16S rRNA (adenine1518-N6/adenine1519-N6)-dimethyltransferase
MRHRSPGSDSAEPRSHVSEPSSTTHSSKPSTATHSSKPSTATHKSTPDARDAPSQPTLRRLRQFDVRPDRELGQNFLIDSNILGVISRIAELSDADVVLEIGGGVGVLSEYLAARAAYVHVVEIDERLREPLSDATARFTNVALHWDDALKVDLAGMCPAPTKVIANLPYGVAATALLRTIEELPTVTHWVAMVQREVGERLAADPGGRDYGVPSVLAQLACRVRVARTIPRTVFHPVPNVDSVLVELTRTGAAATPALRALVAGAFAHRRKALARSLALAGVAEREQVRAALASIGLPLDVRAERLAPREFAALAEALELNGERALAEASEMNGEEGPPGPPASRRSRHSP